MGDNNRFLAKGYNLKLVPKFPTWKVIDFVECRFNFKKDKELLLVQDMTFRDCSFTSCFMSACHFKNVRFDNCSFTNTDFFNSIFESCTFKNCIFRNCLARYTRFERTSISAKSFFSGLRFPKERYVGDESRNLLDSHNLKFLENRIELAQHIYRSNADLSAERYTDEALYFLKKFELCSGFSNARIWNYPALVFEGLGILITKGGTSLPRLLVSGVLFLVLFTHWLKNSTVEYLIGGNKGLAELSFSKSLSVFLGFGFTNCKLNSFSDLVLVVFCATTGIFWYSLLIPVLFRKIYR